MPSPRPAGRASVRAAVVDVDSLERRELFNTDVMIQPLHGGGCNCFRCSMTSQLQARRAVDAAPAIRVNFQPETAQDVPPGYRADVGRRFGDKPNGYAYGWNRDKQSDMVDRGSKADVPNARYRTFADMDTGDRWEIELPEGTYDVTVVAGDAGSFDAVYRMSAEGKPIMHGIPRDNYRWIEGTDRVTVTDGRLTLTPLDGAKNLKLAFVEIKLVDKPDYRQTNGERWYTSDIQTSLGRFEAGSVRVGDQMFVMGGFAPSFPAVTGRTEVIDLASGDSRRLASLPGAQTHFGIASDGRFIYVAGGQYGEGENSDGTNEVWRYDPKKNRWNRSINLPEVRFAGSLVYSEGALHYISGCGPDRITPEAEHWVLRYDQIDAGWQQAAPPPRAFDHAGTVYADGKIYVVGGEHGHGTSYAIHRDTQIYDVATDTWTLGQEMPVGASHIEGGTFLHDGKIWVLGGLGVASQVLTSVRVYDIAADRWEIRSDLSEQRKGGVAWVYGNRAFYGFGETVNIFNPRSVIAAELDL